MQKGFSLIQIIIAVCLVIVLGIGTYVYFSNNDAKSTTTPTKNHVGNGPDECSRIQVTCVDGFQRFDDESGCGCEEVEGIIQGEPYMQAQPNKVLIDGSLTTPLMPDEVIDEILFDISAGEKECGPQPPGVCEEGMRFGCVLPSKKWGCQDYSGIE